MQGGKKPALNSCLGKRNRTQDSIALLPNPKSRKTTNQDPQDYFLLGLESETNGDLSKAIYNWHLAASQGHERALLYLGICYKNGIGVARDQKKAFSSYLRIAQKGNPIMQYNIAMYYLSGIGVAKDKKKGLDWLLLGAQGGFAPAMLKLSQILEESDAQSSHTWALRTAKQGCAVLSEEKKDEIAFREAILSYSRASGREENTKSCLDWYRSGRKLLCLKMKDKEAWEMVEHKSSIQKTFETWCLLSSYYSYLIAAVNVARWECARLGAGGSITEAIKWYTFAANEGYAPAQFALGVLYWKGEGVKRDLETAIQWYQSASNFGHVRARYNMGVCYEFGNTVVKKDLAKARKFYTLAAQDGHEKAKLKLKELDEQEKQDKVDKMNPKPDSHHDDPVPNQEGGRNAT